MSKQETAGLLADERFINYCFGRNANDIAYWEGYLRAHPDEKEHFEELKAIVLLTSRSVKNKEVQSQLQKLKQGIHYRESITMDPVRSKYNTHVWKVAAMISGILLTGMLTWFYFSAKQGSRVETVSLKFATEKAERKSFVLPDGSKVVLNAESHISLSDHFNEKDRVVELSGEAFFDVTHDTSRPFVVKTNNMDVQVLGTAFNVKAYDGDETSETSLIRGSVELSLKKEHKKVTLSPNEKYLLRTSDSKTNNQTAASSPLSIVASGLLPVRVSQKDTAIVEVSWTENKLVFVDEPFEALVKQLGRWYGVNIEIVDPALKNISFTASFRNEGIEDVLATLQFIKAFNYERKNNTIMIYK